MSTTDPDTLERAVRLRRMTADYLRAMSPQERDRMMQVHLAQARGPQKNLELLRRMTARMARIRNRHADETPRTMADPLVDVMQATIHALVSAGAQYVVIGSVAGSIHGEPVLSMDVNIVVRMTVDQARQVAGNLPDRFYRNVERFEEVARQGGIANVIDADSGLKVDLSALPDGPFYDSVLARRVSIKFGADLPAFFTVTAEDVILMKLVWRRETKSQKQWENALSVARVQGARMDWKYLFDQAQSLGLDDDLARLREEAGI